MIRKRTHTQKTEHKPFNILEAFRYGEQFLTFEEVRDLVIMELVSDYGYTVPQGREAVDVFLNQSVLFG